MDSSILGILKRQNPDCNAILIVIGCALTETPQKHYFIKIVHNAIDKKIFANGR